MKPGLATTIDAAARSVASAREKALTIGFVPTMGALHEGHASLIRAARAQTGFVVVSIFVNPTQFGPTEDLARYPRPLDQDLDLCRRESVDLVFAPKPEEMYPQGFRTFVEVTGLQDVLCGASRPGHFRGVATVVLKLFQIVQPDLAYFGQKDAQQARIIQQMVADLNLSVQVRVCPIIRAPDGLALSSRNHYLDPRQRENATILFRSLQKARSLVEAGERNASVLKQQITSMMESTPGAAVDYVAVVNAVTLQPLDQIEDVVLVALAVKFGTTRLIDNILLKTYQGSE